MASTTGRNWASAYSASGSVFLPLPGARTFVSHVVAAAAADPALLLLLPTVASGPNAVNRKKTNEKARSKQQSEII